MSITIKDVYGKTLYVSEGAASIGAALSEARIDGANLSGADLYGANLSGANLYGADLSGAAGYKPLRVNDLLLLLDQPGKIRAYKLVTAKGEGPTYGGIQFEVGGTYEVPNANTNGTQDCGAGINVATLPWCLRAHRDGYRILVVEFTKKDIAAIPTSDGKFRLHRCKVVKELNLDELDI